MRSYRSCERCGRASQGRASKDRAIIGVGRATGFKSRADTNHCKIFAKVRLAFAILGKWNVLGIS